MAQSADPKQHGPHEPSEPEIDPKRNEYDDGHARNPPVSTWSQGENDVPTIQLPAGKQVESSGKHPHPSRNRNRVQQHLPETGQPVAGARAGKVASQLEDEWKSQFNVLIKSCPSRV